VTSPTFVSAWYEKFHDLPIIPARSVLAPMDGDIAWLHHLRSALQAHQDRYALAVLADDFIYYCVLADTGIVPSAMDWPDLAGARLAAWRAGA
jgi:hypothetical protein